MHDVIASLYGDPLPGLALAIYDAWNRPPRPCFIAPLKQASSTILPLISANEYLVVAGHNWTLSMSTLDDFKGRFGRNAEMLIAGRRYGLSLLLALLAWLMVTGRGRRHAAGFHDDPRVTRERGEISAPSRTARSTGKSGGDRMAKHAGSIHRSRKYTGYTVAECMAMRDFAGTLIYPGDRAAVAPEFLKGSRASVATTSNSAVSARTGR